MINQNQNNLKKERNLKYCDVFMFIRLEPMLCMIFVKIRVLTFYRCCNE